MTIREQLKKRILSIAKAEGSWVYKELDKMLDKGVEVIDRNLEQGNFKEVNDKVISWTVYKLYDQYY